MNYRKKLYSEYVSHFTSDLYGKVSLDKIKQRFPVWRKYYRKFLPEDGKIKILDLACGNGSFIWWLQKIGYKNSFGIDISEEQIKSAKKLGIKNVEKVDLREYLKDKKETYDVIFARDILEHFKKQEILEVLELVYNALSKNGKFIMKSPNAESPFGGRYRYGDFTHEIAFTRSSLSQVLKTVGFRKIKCFPVKPVVHGFKSLIRAMLWCFIDKIWRLYLLIETGSYKGYILTQNLWGVAWK